MASEHCVHVLAVDPGRTTGIVLLTGEEKDGKPHFTVQRAYQRETITLGDTLDLFALNLGWLLTYEGIHPGTGHVVLEDYRVYTHMAKHHIGKRLYPAEQLGAIRGYMEHIFPGIMVHILGAQKKGRWPDARIETWGRAREHIDVDAALPDSNIGYLTHGKVHKPHAWDAMKLALTVAEEELL